MTPQQANRIADCPFCGSANIAVGYSGQPAQSFHMRCISCGATGPGVMSPSPAGGAFPPNVCDSWNRRAPAPTEPAVDFKKSYVVRFEDIGGSNTEGLDSSDLYVKCKACKAVLATPASPAVPVADCGPNPVTWQPADVARLDAALHKMFGTPAVPAPAPLAPIPDVLFDGMAVYEEITRAGGHMRTSAENVSEVLDAVVRLLRASQPTSDPKGGIDVDDLIRDLGIETEVARIRADEFSQATSTPEAVNLLVEEAKRVMGQG